MKDTNYANDITKKNGERRVNSDQIGVPVLANTTQRNHQ